MLFSLLRMPRKITGMLVGVGVGGLSLWAIASWQALSWQSLLGILLGSVLMLGATMLAALLLVAGAKLSTGLAARLARRDTAKTTADRTEGR